MISQETQVASCEPDPCLEWRHVMSGDPGGGGGGAGRREALWPCGGRRVGVGRDDNTIHPAGYDHKTNKTIATIHNEEKDTFK